MVEYIYAYSVLVYLVLLVGIILVLKYGIKGITIRIFSYPNYWLFLIATVGGFIPVVNTITIVVVVCSLSYVTIKGKN